MLLSTLVPVRMQTSTTVSNEVAAVGGRRLAGIDQMPADEEMCPILWRALDPGADDCSYEARCSLNNDQFQPLLGSFLRSQVH